MLSKKLAGAIAGMAAVVLIVALDAWRIVDKEVASLAIVSVTGLGGWQIQQQAKLDKNGAANG